MPISDTQFTAWMNTGAERVLLAEVKYVHQDIGSPSAGPLQKLLYYATRSYRTGAAESPANQQYDERIVNLKFTRDLDVMSLGGYATFSVANLELANGDGLLDYLLKVIVDGRSVDCYLGSPAWDRVDFRHVLSAVAERVVASSVDTIAIQLRDKRLLLDKEIKGNPLGGSSPNADKFLPLLWGYAENMDLTPYLRDASTLEYGVLSNYTSGSQTYGVNDLRDDGISLRNAYDTGWNAGNTSVNIATDVVTHANHGRKVNDVMWFTSYTPADNVKYPLLIDRPFAHAGVGVQLWVKSVPSDNELTFSLTKGGALLNFTDTAWGPDSGGSIARVHSAKFYDDTKNTGRIQLSSKAVGRLTADVFSYPPVSGESMGYATPFYSARSLMYGYGGVDLSEIDTAAAEAADTALDVKANVAITTIWIPERRNLVAVLVDLLDAVFGWFGQDALGKLTFGMLDTSGLSAATPQYYLREVDCDGLSCENLPPTIDRATLHYDLIRTVQTDGLSRLVTDENRMRYSSRYALTESSTAPSGTNYTGNPRLYHKTMTDGAPVEGSINTDIPGLSGSGSVSGYANEIVADRAPHLKVLSTKVTIDKYNWALGGVVQLTHSRFGFGSGVNCRIVGIGVDLVSETVDLRLLTQIAPAYTVEDWQ